MNWTYVKGTNLSGIVILPNGSVVNTTEEQKTQDDEIYFIVTDKCTECIGFHEEPQCVTVYPIDCCIPDDKHIETKEELFEKKNFLHKV